MPRSRLVIMSMDDATLYNLYTHIASYTVHKGVFSINVDV